MVDNSLIYKNPFRVVLTELLPYEVILGFDSRNFFNNLNVEPLEEIVRQNKYVPANRLGKFKIPFDYHVRRSGGEKSRKLSLMHPASQLGFVDFYNTYENSILYYTSLSPISLRFPSKIAKTSCVNPIENTLSVTDGGEAIEIDEDFNSNIETCYKNYFSYRKYGLAYKFFDSFEFLNLEKRFSRMRHLDIASCFYHIYTHSISWAVKDKTTAKKLHADKGIFENKFDFLMSDANFGETNGIIVGPEISRIFAEIIFQRIDLEILAQIKRRLPKNDFGKDFEMRRYVDDYYIFANSVQLLDELQSILTDVIEDYKLYLNKAKIEDMERPMVKSSQIAKAEIKEILSSAFDRWCKSKYVIKDEGKAVGDVINSIRLCIRRTNAKYDDVSSYGLKIIINFIDHTLRSFFATPGYILNSSIFTVLIEIAYFLFAMDWCSSTSYKICQLIFLSYNMCKGDVKIRSAVSHKIVMESKKCLNIMAQTRLKDCTNVETMNLLITMRNVLSHNFSEKTLRKFFNLSETDGNIDLDYFQLCTLLFLCRDDPAYQNLKEFVLETVKMKFKRIPKEDIGNYAELVYLLLDLMTCPYVDDGIKNDVLTTIGFASHKIGNIRTELAKPGCWFFDWNNSTDFYTYLNKKQFSRPYD